MRDQLQLNTQHLRPWFWLSLAVTAASLAALGLIDTHLKNSVAPQGIVSFELCAYQASCDAITASWQGTQTSMAAMSLGLDYLFMLAYPATICLGLTMCAPSLPSPLRRLALLLAWGIWVAAAADALENYHLFQMLMGQPTADHGWPAAVAATVKFAVLVPALVAWLVGFAWPKRSPKTHP
jgi:hypothetical protein